jgi:heparanase 1
MHRKFIALGLAALGLAGCGDDAGAPSVAYTVTVGKDAVVATIDERYLSVGIDTAQVVGAGFWDAAPRPYDFTRARLRRLAGELAPATLRIGGTDADRIYYDLSATPVTTAPAGYQHVLTATEWDAVGELARALDFDLLFTINAGPGPRDPASLAWQDAQARALVQYTVAKGIPVTTWEFGNEINSYSLSLNLDLSTAQLVADVAAAKRLVAELDPGARLAGIASAYWPVVGEIVATYPPFMSAGGGAALDVITWHYYPQQSARCGLSSRRAQLETMLVPANLDEASRWAAEIEAPRDQLVPDAEVWLGESGNAQCGGEPGVSDRFVSGFWWLDQLGLLARRGQKRVVRQTLSGSDYGLIDDDTLAPRPDYFTSVLWRRLVGTRVLDATRLGAPMLRAYAHCARGGPPGAVVLIFVHLDATAHARVSVPELGDDHDAYVLTGAALDATDVLLNGVPLHVDANGALPPLAPASGQGSMIELPPLSYGFVVFPQAGAAACD